VLWPDKKFVITNVIVSQKFLKQHPDVVAAVLRGSVKSNAFLNAHPDEAKKAVNAKLKELAGKALPANVIDPAWQSIRFTDDPLASTLNTEADHAVTAGLLKKPDLKGIYDLTELNKILKTDGKPALDTAGLGAQ
jgi:NitT/TauT family transport system substrate-binding protein